MFFLLLSCQVMSTLHDPMDCFLVALHLPEFAQVPVHWIGEAIQPSHPLLPSSPSACYLSQYQGLFQWVSSSYQMDKYWSFSFILSPSNEYSGLISFKIDCFDLLPVQGALRSLLQNHNLKASILQHSAFFTVQLSQLYKTTGKTIALTIQTLCHQSNVSAFQHTVYVCHSFPAKRTSSDFMAAVTICSDFRAQEEEICHCFHLFPLYLPWSNGAGCHDLSLFVI